MAPCVSLLVFLHGVLTLEMVSETVLPTSCPGGGAPRLTQRIRVMRFGLQGIQISDSPPPILPPFYSHFLCQERI